MADPARRRVVAEFHVGATTHVVVGSGLVDRCGSWAATYGERALLVVGERHARASGLLARVEGALRSSGLQVELVEGIGPNPGVGAIDAAATFARAWRADVVVALGGGSVVDAGKAIATAAGARERRSFADHLSGRRAPDLLVDSVLPVVAIPTLPGSGSETNGTSVITDLETGRKLSAHSELAAPRIALLDPDLLLEVADELLAPGLVDAACHALEAGLSIRATPASDALAEQALRTLILLAGAPLDDTAPIELRLDAITRAWWATNLAGQALTLAGSIVTHPLAHPVSARLDARHGEAVAAIEAATIAVLGDRIATGPQLERVATWLDVRGARDPAKALQGLLTRLGRYCRSLGVTRSLGDIGVDEPSLQVLVRDARASGSRGLAALPGGEPTPVELFRILDLAREHGPGTRPKQLLEAAERLAARDAVDPAT